ncbi:uncharacterized protein N7469_010562 [Penicillium citrinum]|uniref:N-acetyltransferase domain-containing protein n=1 Tax=Penicillium citrinum TaxID=5077 RepID=A0A9W9THJ9_PENCI|nr:uncharacterized protein N7469_010562 [Penicillium citrinum]KAJ5221675.1 hypothetical protein N7469_010562 [Penicillium citrinum]
MEVTSQVPTKGALYTEQPVTVIVPLEPGTIETENLHLRPLRIPHKSIEETEAHIASKSFQTPNASGACGRQFHFAIISAEDTTQRVIGTVGVNSLFPAPSIGYGLHPDVWGKGYAGEAVEGVIDAWWKLDRTDRIQTGPESGKEKLFAACNKGNLGSMKVLQRNGFKIYKEMYIEGDSVALFEIQRPEN